MLGLNDSESTPTPPVPAATAPRAAGFHLALAHPADAVAALLRRTGEQPRVGERPRLLLRRILVPALIVFGAGAVALDHALRFPTAAFSFLVPFAWLGLLVVFHATRATPPVYPDPRSPGGLLRGALGLLLAGLVALLAWSSALRSAARGEAPSYVAFAAVTLVVLALGKLLDGRFQGGRSRSATEALRLAVCAEALAALAEDVPAGRPVSGFIDLTGAEQPSKRVRSWKAASGVDVTLYRDEWLRVRLPLRDGGRLRFSAVDRVKVRAGRFKQGRSRRKWKPGRSDTLASVELQLGFDPARCRLKQPAPQAARFGGLTFSQAAAKDDALSATARVDGTGFAGRDLVSGAAWLHQHLEPLRPAAGTR